MKLYVFTVLVLCFQSAFSQSDTSLLLPMFRGSVKHSGVYTAKNYTGIGDVKWTFHTKGKIFSSPVVSDGIIYVGSEDKNLYAVDAVTGKEQWKFKAGGAIHSSPAVYKDVVYFTGFDGFYAVDKSNGTLKWKFKTGGEKHYGQKGLWGMQPENEFQDDPFDFFLSSPVIGTDEGNETAYFGSGDNNVYALDVNTGKLKWQFKTGGVVHTSPALSNGKLFIGSWDTYMYALDAKTGKELWKFKTLEQPKIHQLDGIQASATIYQNTVFFGARDAYFYAVDINTGKLKWKYFNDNSWVLTTAATVNGSVYFATSDPYQMVSMDAVSGKLNWKFQANGYLYSSPSIAGSNLFFGDFTGKLFALDIKTGKQTGEFATNGRIRNAATVLNANHIDFAYMSQGLNYALYSTTTAGMQKLYTLGSIVSSSAIYNGIIYFGSAEGNLYAINLKE
jgi:outer membrane protein assembly factor BamB